MTKRKIYKITSYVHKNIVYKQYLKLQNINPQETVLNLKRENAQNYAFSL